MFLMGVAQTSEMDGHIAATSLLEQCRQNFGDTVPQAGLLIAGHDLELDDFLTALFAIYPELLLIGCTTVAPMSSAASYDEGATTLSLFASDQVDFSVGIGFPDEVGIEAAAEQAVSQAKSASDQNPALCLTVTSLEALDPIALTDALNRALGDDVVLFGGGSVPDFPMTPLWRGSSQILNREVLSDGVPVLLMSGPLKVSVGIGHGWTPTGREAVVTKSEPGRILEINERPAVEFYHHYLGTTADAALAAPIAVTEPGAQGHYLRATGGFDDDGAAVLQGLVPQGSRIQITLSSVDEIVDGAGTSAQKALAEYPPNSKPQAALVSSCAIRNVLLGGRSAGEIVSIRNALGEDIPVQGLYAYGEIAPITPGAESRFHNNSCCTVLIGT
ncbi:MAG: FIST N-terminal domain-containing protein [Pseudomonadota bacterium]